MTFPFVWGGIFLREHAKATRDVTQQTQIGLHVLATDLLLLRDTMTMATRIKESI